MDDAAHGNDCRVTPSPSPPSMIADPAETAILDELSIITHALRRDSDLRWRVLHLVKERLELQKYAEYESKTRGVSVAVVIARELEAKRLIDELGISQTELDRAVQNSASRHPYIGELDSATRAVTLPTAFDAIGCDDIGCGYCECDE